MHADVRTLIMVLALFTIVQYKYVVEDSVANSQLSTGRNGLIATS